MSRPQLHLADLGVFALPSHRSVTPLDSCMGILPVVWESSDSHLIEAWSLHVQATTVWTVWESSHFHLIEVSG